MLLIKYKQQHGKELKPVNYRNRSIKIPEAIFCPFCGAPHSYLYFNNGSSMSQFLCKVCSSTFYKNIMPSKTKYECPYCNHALFKWKEKENVALYKCGNYNCQCYLDNLKKLNDKEKILYKKEPNHFTLHYIYREYHFEIEQLQHSKPGKSAVDLNRIYNSQTILGLILTFYVSFSVSARKTALILKWVFQINVSYQTILNYANAASYYCHQINMKYKGGVDDLLAGDETYIKVRGENNYIFFFISAKKRSIASYHFADNRGTLPAITAMLEAKRTAKPDQQITYITDGNPSYPAGIHFINQLDNTEKDIQHHKVIGLQNLDSESEEYRSFKQIVERLNRTYKHHVKKANGFNSSQGAIALTTLFVTYYNFLRPHSTLKYKTPVHLNFLDGIQTIQAKWCKILSMAYG